MVASFFCDYFNHYYRPHAYGQIYNTDLCRIVNSLPMGLSQGRKLIKEVKKIKLLHIKKYTLIFMLKIINYGLKLMK